MNFDYCWRHLTVNQYTLSCYHSIQDLKWKLHCFIFIYQGFWHFTKSLITILNPIWVWTIKQLWGCFLYQIWLEITHRGIGVKIFTFNQKECAIKYGQFIDLHFPRENQESSFKPGHIKMINIHLYIIIACC